MPVICCGACGYHFEATPGLTSYCPQCGHPVRGIPAHLVPAGYDLRLLAGRQRLLLWAILSALLFSCVSPLIFFAGVNTMVGPTPGGSPALSTFALIMGMAIPMIQIGATVFTVVVSILVMAASRTHIFFRILAALFLFIPLVNLITLLSINRRVTKILRDSGLRVGFMGVKDSDVANLLSGHICVQCGYDLTGNVSGFCTECGRGFRAT